MKNCSKCGETKKFSEFRKDSRHVTGLHSWCKTCSIIKEKTRYARDSVRIKSRMRNAYKRNIETCKQRSRHYYHLNKVKRREYRLKKTFSISTKQYTNLTVKQQGVCAICQKPETMLKYNKVQALSIDHNHETGELRGLLCSRCNVGIGYLGDSAKIIRAALTYIESWNKK